MNSQRRASALRLRKHADYQRVYQASRKHFSGQFSYFFVRAVSPPDAGVGLPRLATRVGLTVPKVLGKAVDRNRIKRRLRELIRRNHSLITSPTDVILHPKRLVLHMEFGLLEHEVISIFKAIQRQADPVAGDRTPKAPQRRAPRPAALSGAR